MKKQLTKIFIACLCLCSCTIIIVCLLAYGEAKRKTSIAQGGKRFLELNYYANLRFLITKIFGEEVWLSDLLKTKQYSYYLAVTAGAEEEYKIYADYLYYIKPIENAKLSIHKSRDRESLHKAIELIEHYAEASPENTFLLKSAFPQLARTYKFATHEKGIVEIIGVSRTLETLVNAWKGFEKYSPYFAMKNDDDIYLHSEFYYRVLSSLSGIIANKWQSIPNGCKNEIVPAYQEMRKAFVKNSDYFLSLLKKDGIVSQEKTVQDVFSEDILNKADSIIDQKCKG